jgi:hypothetical protein
VIPACFEEAVLVDFEFNNGERNPRGEGNRPYVMSFAFALTSYAAVASFASGAINW